MDTAATIGLTASISAGASVAYMYGRLWLAEATARRNTRRTARNLATLRLDPKTLARVTQGR